MGRTDTGSAEAIVSVTLGRLTSEIRASVLLLRNYDFQGWCVEINDYVRGGGTTVYQVRSRPLANESWHCHL